MASTTLMASMTASSSASMSSSSRSGHGMDMGGGSMVNDNACKISMLWNWYTIDACFLSSSWHVRSAGAFAASCIGVALLVVSLEFLRRVGKEYDAILARQFRRHVAARQASLAALSKDQVHAKSVQDSATYCQPASTTRHSNSEFVRSNVAVFRATPLQQLIRAIIHAAIFGVAYIIMLLAMYFNGYIIMLLAMYFNGYIIISIIIGAGIGKFFFDWMVVKVPLGTSDGSAGAYGLSGAIEEPTVCCG